MKEKSIRNQFSIKNKFDSRKEIVLSKTKGVYEKYKKKGLISIYWYGSGINEGDFNENSDIDLMGIAKDELDINFEAEMINELQLENTLDIKIRILYLSELNGGDIKSSISKFLPLKLWLIDFKKYILLQGKKFNERDFYLKKASFSEAVKLQRQIYLKKREQFLKDNKSSMYLIKSALYYFYYKSCQKKGYFSFLYNNLSENVLGEYKAIVGRLLAIKNKKYDVKSTKKITEDLERLILK